MIGRSSEVKRLRRTICAEAKGKVISDEWTLANRLFTFAWHNEWMYRKLEGGLGEEIRSWLDRHESEIKGRITHQPNALDLNLKYHWWHFMTQHNVWMRDWCLAGDPDSPEQNKPASGSKNPEDNICFFKLVEAILASGDDGESAGLRLRNCIMLLGTRSARLPVGCDAREILGARLSDRTAGFALQAIFELAREGYLAEGWPDTSTEFNVWCKEQDANYSSIRPEAWKRYSEELKMVTHLDLVPEEWEEIRPAHW